MRGITERKAVGLAAVVLLAGSASVSIAGSLTHAVAAPAISVFVGYADSDRRGGDFPNPWNGSPNVTFDGCSPQSACVFDGGAVRVRNDSSTPAVVDQLSVHIDTCLYTWSGTMYPVTLGPGASLITTQRASGVADGCTGPDPATFDSSDIPKSGTCTNDGIQPTVDVTVNGATSSYTDSGQVLNTGGFDPGNCSGSDESTEWVRIGSRVCPGQTLNLVPVAQTDSVGTTASVTATFADACGSPLPDVVVAFRVTSGPNAGAAGSAVTDGAGNATFTYSSVITGTDSLQAAVTNAVGFTRTSNTATVTWTVEFAPGGGSFVIGNGNAAVGTDVNFWGSQWAIRNSLTGGPAPRSFKGFADAPVKPACGQAWTSDPGNSTPPPDGPLPSLMAVIVTSSAQKVGPEISGDIVAIVLVRTKPGYAPNPGHRAFGTVIAVICGAAAAAPAPTAPRKPQPPVASHSKPTASTGAGASPASAGCQPVARGKSTTYSHGACGRKNHP